MNPSGICKCGCGGKTPLRTKGNKRLGLVKGEPCDYIGNHGVRGNLGKGSEHHKWNGGRKINRGYVQIWQKDHPRADGHGYVLEHILVVEQMANEPLPKGFVVHHINGIKNDNRPENLLVFKTNSEHINFHTRLRAEQECGHSEWRKCPFCKQYDDPSKMKKNGRTYLHTKCASEYNKIKKTKGI